MQEKTQAGSEIPARVRPMEVMNAALERIVADSKCICDNRGCPYCIAQTALHTFSEEARRERHRAYCLAWIRKHRNEWLQANGPCRKCGSWERLEVDHIDPTTKVNHKVWSWKPERRIAELAKCQVLCHTCHLKKSLEYRKANARKDHGNSTQYRNGCRCFDCRAAQRARLRRSKNGEPPLPRIAPMRTLREADKKS